MDSSHASPFEEGLSHSSQRVAQLASLMGALAQVALQRKALAEARKAAVNDKWAIQMLGDQEHLLHRRAG